MLPVEPVLRPTANIADAAVWRLGFPASFLGARGKEDLIRTFALHLSEVAEPVRCTVWNHEEGPTYFVYLVFEDGKEAAEVIERVSEDLDPKGSLTTTQLPGAASPVLKRTGSGALIRLWPADGQKRPERQKVTVDWGTFEVTNRVYEILGE